MCEAKRQVWVVGSSEAYEWDFMERVRARAEIQRVFLRVCVGVCDKLGLRSVVVPAVCACICSCDCVAVCLCVCGSGCVGRWRDKETHRGLCG